MFEMLGTIGGSIRTADSFGFKMPWLKTFFIKIDRSFFMQRHGRNLAFALLSLQMTFLVALSPFCSVAFADLAGKMSDCAKIDNSEERLKCFDDLAGRQTPLKAKTPTPATADAKTLQVSKPSVMSRQWELDPQSRKEYPSVRSHHSSYILPLAYNTTPNGAPFTMVDPTTSMQYAEAKYQLSFKTKLWEDVFGKDMDLWFGYTQIAFWQMYNKAFSSPFRDTNYEPELILNFRTNYDLLGLKGRIINLGINHQSNGRAEPLSRSWNRIVASAGFEKDDFNLILKTWYRIPESAQNDDNPGIEAYMGYGEIWGSYYWREHKFSVMLRNNLRVNDNKGAAQIEWGFPLPFIKNNRFSGYVQYFNGYGESLIDYNASSNRFSIGIILTDWK
ncbi:MAG: putative phospholipase A1 [Syntrophus sp. SKADARSKE-3]|nr:putative phospholipase A1 [Syntrophus sp. SKADARSKE-3]